MKDESIIQTLCEARLVRNKSMLSSYNAKDVADLIFLYFIALTIMKKDFESAAVASGYAKHAMRYGNWDDWRFSYNDLGILIHTLFGKKNQRDELRDKPENEIFFRKIRFNEQEVKNWLRDVVRGIDRTNRDRRFLLNLEKNLGIDNSNYRSMRRLASEWNELQRETKALVMTRLLQALRIRARKSELLPVLTAMARAENLELQDADNPEAEGNQNRTNRIKSAAKSAGLTVAAGAAGAAFGHWRAKKKAEKRRASYNRRLYEDEEYTTAYHGSPKEFDDLNTNEVFLAKNEHEAKRYGENLYLVTFSGEPKFETNTIYVVDPASIVKVERVLSETASAGATSAGAVAAVPGGLFGPGPVKRNPVDYKVLRRNEKKTGGMAVAPDPRLQRAETEHKKRRKDKK